MPKSYPLSIVTPEREFFEGDVYSITVEGIGGRFSVLAGHAPMVTALSPGMLVLRDAGGERTAFHSLGFVEISNGRVVLLVQACEWPEEIDERRARDAERRARARLDSKNESVGRAEVALMRALQRMKVAANLRGRRDSMNH